MYAKVLGFRKTCFLHLMCILYMFTHACAHTHKLTQTWLRQSSNCYQLLNLGAGCTGAHPVHCSFNDLFIQNRMVGVTTP